MGVIKKRVLSLIIAVVLSLILHIVVIAGISGIDLFSFRELFAVKPFHAKIVSESPKKSNLDKIIKEPPQVQPEDISQTDDREQKPNDRQLQVNPHEVDTITVGQPSEDPTIKKPAQTDNNEIQQIVSLPVSEKPAELHKTQDAIQILRSTRERFDFDIYWLGIYVGKAVLEAVNDKGNVRIIAQVHSAPLISTFYKVENYAESQVINGIPSFFKIKQRQGKKRADKETLFDMPNKKITYINHIKGTRDEHSINAENLWDVMSGFYYLRTQRFSVGETIYIDLFDSNKFYKAEVEVIRKDKVTVSDEKELDVVVVKPRLKSEGLFENKGDISVWLSDDDMKIPLKVETEVSIGRVVAELKSLEIDDRK